MAAATTSMEATPSATNVASPESSMPAIAIMTVKPEISTAWPEVDAAISSALRRFCMDCCFASRTACLAETNASASPERFAARRACLAAAIAAVSAGLVAIRSRRSRCR